jgi:hypothetical protein
MAMMLPYSKKEGLAKAFFFPLIAMVAFDILTNRIGVWTIVTSLTYAGLGGLFYFYFKNFGKISLKRYIGSSTMGVLIFDFITGVIASPFMFGMTFEQAFLGQIPFTIMHLVTVTAYVILIVPVLDKHVIENKKLDDNFIAGLLRNKLFQKY